MAALYGDHCLSSACDLSSPKYSVTKGSNLILWHIDKMVNTYHKKSFKNFASICVTLMGLPVYFPEDLLKIGQIWGIFITEEFEDLTFKFWRQHCFVIFYPR